MSAFTFAATDQAGKRVTGVRTASSRGDLISLLRAENLVVTSVAEERSSAAESGQARSAFMDNLLLGRIRNSDLMVLTRQLAAILKAGVSLTDSLQTIAHASNNLRLRKILLQVRADVQRGRSLTEAMHKHRTVFDQLFVSMIHAGETSGSMVQNLSRLSEYLDRGERFRRKIQTALLYPKIIMVVFTVITSLIFLLLIPRFSEIYGEFNATLPPLSAFFINISMFLRRNILIILPSVAAVIGLCMAVRRTRQGAEWLDKVMLKVPVLGPLLLMGAIARLSMTLGTLLGNGIPLIDALRIAGATLNNSVLEERLDSARRNVMKGFGLAESFMRVREFPRLLPRMVRVGEESGSLSSMLEDVATYYDQEVDFGLNRIAAMVQPLLICGLGVVVLITLIAVYLPIFSLGGTMHGG